MEDLQAMDRCWMGPMGCECPAVTVKKLSEQSPVLHQWDQRAAHLLKLSVQTVCKLVQA